MAKKQDFKSKVAKQAGLGNVCQVCETPYQHLQKIESFASKETNSWKYASTNIKVCKCNEETIYK